MVGEAVAVNDSPAVLLASGGVQEVPRQVIVTNPAASDTAFLGGSGVDSTDGFPLAAGQTFSATLVGGDDLYAICAAAGSTTLNVLRSEV